MTTITENKLRAMGVETVSRFAGCINVNYLVYMKGGLNGYSSEALENIKSKQTNYVKENFEAFIVSVVALVNGKTEAVTTTDKYLKKEYKKWYS